MKKMLAMIALFGALTLGLQNTMIAQDGDQGAIENAAEQAGEMLEEAADSTMAAAEDVQEVVENVADNAAEAVNAVAEDGEKEVLSFHQEVKRLFIEGGANFMAFVLICLIFGLALAIERIIYLNMATTNTSKLLASIENALQSGGVAAAKDVCRNTSGPVASIFYQGLDRSGGSTQDVAKAIEDNGSVEMAKLERGLSWISLFIALAPMLGFMGTVIGMIGVFDKIAEANTINASIVAGGIKVALITTVSGLVVAIILQVFYNYILSKIDSIVLDMEESSMDLIDLLYKREIAQKG
ncbi:MAG: MotA/TolQ/ExbB proton channel family protein [Flavobacteriales bacterium]|nr:MotA/TolQ/ExbB proton channel family protein [Flavobacteriales bacterium]